MLITERAFVIGRSPSFFIDIYCSCNFFFKTTDPGKCNPLVIQRPLIRDVSRDNLTHGPYCESFILQLSFLSAVFHLYVFLSEPGWVTRARRMRLIHLPVFPTAFHVHWHLGSRSEALAAGTGIIGRNHSFPLGKGSHGANPRGGRRARNRAPDTHTPPEGRRTIGAATLVGVCFCFQCRERSVRSRHGWLRTAGRPRSALELRWGFSGGAERAK